MNRKLSKRPLRSLWILSILVMMLGCNRPGYTPGAPVEVITRTPAVATVHNPLTGESLAITQETETPAASDSPRTTPESYLPIALVSLKGHTIHFDCLERTNCIPEVDLENHTLLDSYYVGWVYYWNPESMYVMLFSNSAIPEKMDILHVNPQTGAIKTIRSPDEGEFSLMKIAAGRLILARDQGQIVYIIENDLSITPVNTGVDIYQMIVDGDKVIALNQVPVEKDGQIYVDVSVVGVVSRQAKTVRLNLPGLEILHGRATPDPYKRYLSHVEGVSGDLKNLYCGFMSGGKRGSDRLGTFAVGTSRLITATKGGVSFGYSQYHKMLYRGYSEMDDGGPGAGLYDMSTGRSLLDADWIGKKLMIVPFGESFLLGRSEEVILLSPTGAIVKRYALPEEWKNRDYKLVWFE